MGGHAGRMSRRTSRLRLRGRGREQGSGHLLRRAVVCVLALVLAGVVTTGADRVGGAVAIPPAGTPVPGQPLDPDAMGDQLQAVVDRQVAAAPGIPGLLVHVGAPALGLAWSGAAGLFDRASGQELVPDHTFRIASNTKTFTAAAMLRLVEDGKVGIDQPIAEVLPAEYVALLTSGGYAPDAIRVRHLLTHTGGLYDYASDPAFQEAVLTDPAKRWTRAEQVRFAMERGDPHGAPGEAFHYSDTGYVLLGEIVERATGQSLAAAYRELLAFARLGLDDTYLETLEPEPPGVSARAHQYFGDLDATDLDPSFDLYGGGGLVSNVADLGRFYRALFRCEVFARPETLETMLSVPPANAEVGGAMGLFAYDLGGERCWGHGGFWGSQALHCPEIDVTLVYSINQAEAGDGFDESRLLVALFAVIARR